MTVDGSHPSACVASSGFNVARSLKPTRTRCPEQNGHPEPTERSPTRASHWCPCAHRQDNFITEPEVKFDGSQPSACAASSGCVTLNGSLATNRLHLGQELPFARDRILLTQVCPAVHFQRPTLFDNRVMVVGSQPSACAASSGSVVARSLRPARTRCPEQYGHHSVFIRPTMRAVHSCPFVHLQPTFLFDPAVNVVGSQPSACAANSG